MRVSMQLAASLVVVALLLPSLARADPDRDPSKYKDRTFRQKQDNHRWRVDSFSSDGTVKGFARSEFTTDGMPRWRHMFFVKDGASDAKYKFRVRLLGFFEFADTGAEGWDGESITAKTYIRLAGETNRWGNIQYSEDAGLGRYYGNTTYTKSGSGTQPTLRINNVVARTHHVVDNATFDGNRMTWQVLLNDFQYTSGGSTKVAAIVAVESSSDCGQPKASEDRPHAVNEVLVSGDGVAKLRWKTTIDCTTSGGTSAVSVIPSTLRAASIFPNNFSPSDSGDDDDDSRETMKVLVLTFNTTDVCTSFNWDPETVMDTNALALSPASVNAVLMPLLLAPLTLLALLLGNAF